MPSPIREKPPGSGRYYVNYFEEDGSESTVPLSALGPLTPKVRSIVERLIRVGTLKAQAPPRGRPRRGAEEPVTPAGLERLTPAEVWQACLDALEQDVVDGNLAKNTWKGRGYQAGKMLREFGGESWGPWIKRYGAWTGDMEDATRSSYDAAIGVLVTYGQENRAHVPDLRKVSPRKKQTPTRKRNRRRKKKASTKWPYDLSEVARILEAAAGYFAEPYMAFYVPVCAYMGFSSVDAHRLLAGRYEVDEGFSWGDSDAASWYGYWRVKSEESPNGGVPVPEPVVDLLHPYRQANGGLDIGLAVATWDHEAWYPRLREHYREVERIAGVKPRRGHAVKRLRHTFQVQLENRVTVGDPPRAVPLPVRKRLMGQEHERSSEDVIALYGCPEDDLCIEASKGYVDLIHAASGS